MTIGPLNQDGFEFKIPMTHKITRIDASKPAFCDAMYRLDMPAAAQMMSYLEWHQNNNGDMSGWHYDVSRGHLDYVRFTMNGMSLLANISVSDPRWDLLPNRTTEEERYQIIHAARLALAPENQIYLAEVHGGDNIFQAFEVNNWLALWQLNEISSQTINGPIRQGTTGNCFVLSAILAAAATNDGQQAIEDAITQNADGSYTVTFKGDPTYPITVTQADLETYTHSSGDIDAAILEVAIEKYSNFTGMNGGTTAKGGDGGVVLALLLGRPPTYIIRKGSPEQFANEVRLTGFHVPPPNLVFSCMVDRDGRPSLTGTNSHAFAITKIDAVNNTITFLNPLDTSNPITMSIDEFVQYSDHVQVFQPVRPPNFK